MMVRFIDDHRDAYGFKPIRTVFCRSLYRRIIAIARANSIQGVARPARTVMTRCALRFSGSTTHPTKCTSPVRCGSSYAAKGSAWRAAPCGG